MRKFLLSIIDNLFPHKTEERPSPKIRITPEQADQVIKAVQKIPGMEDCFIAGISETNSMEPTVDDGMYVILQPRLYGDLIVGDIIMYEHPGFNAGKPVFHRIVEKGIDTEVFYRTKGDNNAYIDPIKIRPEHLKGVWRATID